MKERLTSMSGKSSSSLSRPSVDEDVELRVPFLTLTSALSTCRFVPPIWGPSRGA